MAEPSSGSVERVALDLYYFLVRDLPTPASRTDFGAAAKAHLDIYAECLNVAQGGGVDPAKLKLPA